MVPAVQILWVERPRDPRADGRGRQSPSLKETIATLPGGWDLAHAIRLGIKPFAELGANSEALSGSQVDSSCSYRAIFESAPVAMLQPPLKAQLYTDTTPVCLLTLSPCQGLRPQENESNHRSCNPVPRARGPFRAAALAYPGQIAIILLSPLLAEGAGLERCGSRKLHEHDAPAQRDQAGDEHADGGNPQHVPSR